MSGRKKPTHTELFTRQGSRKTRAHTPVDHRSAGIWRCFWETQKSAP